MLFPTSWADSLDKLRATTTMPPGAMKHPFAANHDLLFLQHIPYVHPTAAFSAIEPASTTAVSLPLDVLVVAALTADSAVYVYALSAGSLRYAFGDDGFGPLQFARRRDSSGVAIVPGCSRVVVSDNGNHRLQEVDLVASAVRPTFVRFLGDARLRRPGAVAATRDAIAVCENEGTTARIARIAVFDYASGDLLARLATANAGARVWRAVVSVAISDHGGFVSAVVLGGDCVLSWALPSRCRPSEFGPAADSGSDSLCRSPPTLSEPPVFEAAVPNAVSVLLVHDDGGSKVVDVDGHVWCVFGHGHTL